VSKVETAIDILKNYASEELRPYLIIARALNDNNPAKRDAARLFDLNGYELTTG
jgi:hypothetical protein